jgi:hypothetical protein
MKTLRTMSLCAAAFLVSFVAGLTFVLGGNVGVQRQANFADAALIG